MTTWATTEQIAVDKVVTEVRFGTNRHRRRICLRCCDPSVKRIVVEHRDRFCRFKLSTSKRRWPPKAAKLVVVNSAGSVTTWYGT